MSGTEASWPERGIEALSHLVELGFTDDQFRRLHHMRERSGGIEGFRRYCIERVSSFQADRNNERVVRRLEFVLRSYRDEFRGLPANRTDVLNLLADVALPGHSSGAVTRIVTSTHRYKRPPRGRTIFLIVLAAITPAAADVPEPQYGTYVCVTDRAVGFQTSISNDKERFAGNIIFPPEHQRFFVTIRKISQMDDFMRDGWLKHWSERCFSDQTMKRLQLEWENNGSSVGEYQYPDIRGFQQWCLATSQVQIRTGDTKESYYSIGNNIFTDEQTGFGFTRPADLCGIIRATPITITCWKAAVTL